MGREQRGERVGEELAEVAGSALAIERATEFFDQRIAHAGLGIAPAVGAAAGLVRSLGELRAKQVLLLSEPVDAATMAAYGLVAEVTPAGELERRTTELAGTLSRRSPVSVAAMKAMVHQALQPSWEQTLESDLAFFRHNWNSEAMREGLDAYATRRAPNFGPD